MFHGNCIDIQPLFLITLMRYLVALYTPKFSISRIPGPYKAIILGPVGNWSKSRQTEFFTHKLMSRHRKPKLG